MPFVKRIGLALAATLAMTAGASAATPFTKGEITFTQGGKDATWRLVRGELDQQSTGPVAQLTFSSTGKPTVHEKLELAFGRAGKEVVVVNFWLDSGPGGPGRAVATFASKCALNVTLLDQTGVSGNGACQGPFQGGPAVTKLAFAAKP